MQKASKLPSLGLRPISTDRSNDAKSIQPPRRNDSSPGTATTASVSSKESSEKPQLKTNIEVCARIRPLEIQTGSAGFFEAPSQRRRTLSKLPKKQAPGTMSKQGEICCWDVSEDGETAAQSENTETVTGRTNSFTLDKVYGMQSTTRQLYDNSCHSLVKAAMEGYHSTVLAYGQTASGKTHTMSGTKDSPGLIPLCIEDCFRYVRECQESREYMIRVSYLEVYKEHIRDLLTGIPQPIRIFDGPKGLIIRGLKEVVVSSPQDVFDALKSGEGRRQVGSTHMNSQSSRSHTLVRLWIESTPSDGRKGSSTRASSLSLVDLAGSESVKLNGLERREEGHYINKSLMTLGQVVLTLSEGNTKTHIPFRDSKLTRLLQPSLSGNAQMMLLCCISPQVSHLEESHNTFKFATRAKKIKQKAIVNVADDENTLLQNYRDEIADLRKQLEEAKQQQRLIKEVPFDHKEETDEEVKELVSAIKTMERLILKSRPHHTPVTPRARVASPRASEMMLDDTLDELNLQDDSDDDSQVAILSTTPGNEMLSTPTKDEEALSIELGRIRGLLGTVLKKKGISEDDPYIQKSLDFASPVRSPEMVREVEHLRHQLEEQEANTNLRKADSSFLQSQLREKDQLLEEVSKVLEQVELRQAELERENAALRAEAFALKAKLSRHETDYECANV
ncbi:unnamed protein product [Cylindrotheca closterium]|uniref:Kinesin-like protein n=1 Tax=Cylindrotheca closterium TaxID=2856 RepID=A0AAD2FDM1_9STRA|nr:unnamed protein product [Cylindrotheca closterium]